MHQPLIIASTQVQQDAQGRYCLNDLHRASGGQKRHGPNYWLENQQTKELVDAIAQELSDTGIPVSVVKGGMDQGTFVCKELVYAYAMWISAKFHLQVIRAYDAMVAPVPAAPATLSRMEILTLALDSEKRAVEAEEQLKLAAPAIAHLEAVQSSKDDFTFQEMAHILQEHGYRLGRNRLMDVLRRAGVLTKASNLPMQDYRERGYFRVVESIRESSTGRTHVDLTTYVTGKGHNWLTKAMDALLLKSEKIGGAA